MTHTGRRTFTYLLVYGIICLLVILAIIPFISLVVELISHGLESFNLDFFTQTSPPPTDTLLMRNDQDSISFGIKNGIYGSFLLIVIATVIAVPIGIGCSLYIFMNRSNPVAKWVNYINSVIYGMPSVLIGIIVYLAIEKPMHDLTSLSAGIALAIILLPFIVFTTLKALLRVPNELIRAGLALGATYPSVVWKVVLPTIKKTMIAGWLRGIARVAGETAPLIITLIGSPAINWNLLHSTNAVPLLIWDFLNKPSFSSLVWSSALFLFLFVLILCTIANYIDDEKLST
ncbi:MAG: ABC transporter permease subunit [Dysgonamonadaceae bacterium]|jgi:phosphate transport system permease protein|nr:ABC transporter permease subunit [Dysgonamonadaceae bacterium]